MTINILPMTSHMHVVSNTSPLLNLAITKRLDLLRTQFGVITIPDSVHVELRVMEDMPGVSELRQSILEKWVVIVPDVADTLQRTLERDIDHGEAAAISLAVKLRSDWVLLDDREARELAKSLGVKVTGVVGVILRAKISGHITSARDELLRLRNDAGFRISDELFTRALAAVNE
jgi:predicted nucleic acid-binding protein